MALLGGGLLTWLLVTDSIRDFSTSLYENLVPILMHDWGLTEAQIGLYFSLFALVYALVNLVGSRLADRRSAAGSMALGGSIEAVSLVTLVLFPAASTFTICLVLTGIDRGLSDPAFDALLARSAPPGRMGMTFGTFRTATSFLAMPAPFLGSLMWTYISPLMPFWIGAIFLALAAMLTWVVLRPLADRVMQAASS